VFSHVCFIVDGVTLFRLFYVFGFLFVQAIAWKDLS